MPGSMVFAVALFLFFLLIMEQEILEIKEVAEMTNGSSAQEFIPVYLECHILININ